MIKLLSVSTLQELSEGLKEIYIGAFTSAERREWHKLEDLLNQPKFNLTQVFIDQELIGLITWWNLPEFRFIEHLAIEESSRSKGVGSQVMIQLIQSNPTRIVLEVEESNTKSGKRRIIFYKRLGFSVCESNYWQPPYAPEKRKVKMLLMSFPDRIRPEEFEGIKKYIYTEVYQFKESMDLE